MQNYELFATSVTMGVNFENIGPSAGCDKFLLGVKSTGSEDGSSQWDPGTKSPRS